MSIESPFIDTFRYVVQHQRHARHRLWTCRARALSLFGAGALREELQMRGILLWAVGVPIPIIILIYLLF